MYFLFFSCVFSVWLVKYWSVWHLREAVCRLVGLMLGADSDNSRQRRRPEHLHDDTVYVCHVLLECPLLRGAAGRRLQHPQHPTRLLVGHHYHDNGRLRRRGAVRYHGSSYRRRLCLIRHSSGSHTSSDHRWSFQYTLHANAGASSYSAIDRTITYGLFTY